MMRKRYGLAALAAAAVAFAAAGCGGSSSSTGSTGSSTSAGGGAAGAKLAFFAPVQNSYIQAMVDGARDAAGKRGASVETVFAADGDVAKQIGQIKDATTSKRYDGLLVDPLGPQAAPAILAAVRAGVPVAILGGSLDTDPMGTRSPKGISVTVPDDPKARADGLVELIVDACGSAPCNVGYIMGLKQFPLDVAVLDAIEAALKAHPNIKLVATGEGMYQVGPARTAADDMLRAHPEIGVIATNADIMTEGAALAAKAAGKDVKLIGAGAGTVGCAAVKAGAWVGTTNNVPKTSGTVAAGGVLDSLKDPSKVDRVVNALQAAGVGVATKHGATGCPAQWNG